jgi:hypothetical protein
MVSLLSVDVTRYHSMSPLLLVLDGWKPIAELFLSSLLQVKEERKEHAELGSDLPYNRPLP